MDKSNNIRVWVDLYSTPVTTKNSEMSKFNKRCTSCESAIELIKHGSVTNISFGDDICPLRILQHIEDSAIKNSMPPLVYSYHGSDAEMDGAIRSRMERAWKHWRRHGYDMDTLMKCIKTNKRYDLIKCSTYSVTIRKNIYLTYYVDDESEEGAIKEAEAMIKDNIEPDEETVTTDVVSGLINEGYYEV